MNRYARDHRVQWITTLIIAISILVGCGGDANGSGEGKVLTSGEVKQLLRQLPYRFNFRKVKVPQGASDAVAGRVFGRYRTWFDFGISLGSGQPQPVPVPQSGIFTVVGVPSAGFVYTDNVLVRNSNGSVVAARQIRTKAQGYESSHMGTAIERKLCLAVLETVCPL